MAEWRFSRKLLTEAFGSDTGDKILEKLPGAKKASPGVDSLQKADPQQLARFVHHEHPQTIALVLSSMNPSQAAGLLSSPFSGAAHGRCVANGKPSNRFRRKWRKESRF